MPRAPGKPPFFWVALVLGAFMLSLYAFSGVLIWRHGTVVRDSGWLPARHDGHWTVDAVDPHGPAAGKLQPGDMILAANGDARIARVASRYVWSAALKRDIYNVSVKRGPEQLLVELHIDIKRDYRNLGAVLSNFAVSLAFYIVGLLLGLLKPEERVTRFASLTMLAWSNYTLYIALDQMESLTPWERAIVICINLIQPVQFALSYHFYYRFPDSAPRGRLWTSLQYLLYSWAAFLYMRRVWFTSGRLQPDFIGFLLDHAGTITFGGPNAILELAAVLAMCAVVTRNYVLVREPDQRRRIKWMVYGSIVGILPSLVFNLLKVISPVTGRPVVTEGGARYLSFVIGNFMTVAIPIAVGFAVLKRRLFDVQVVIRRGVQYLFAKHALRALLAVPIAALALAMSMNRNRPLAEILGRNPLLLVLAAAAAFSLKYRQQLTTWIDRRFFREAYNQERILLNLIDRIKELDSMPELSRLVSREVEAAMHPERVYTFYRGDEKRDLTLGYSSSGDSRPLRIADESELLQWMRRQRGAQDFPPPPNSGLPEAASSWLAELQVTLIVPMGSADGRLGGLLLLGAKKSEQPYTAVDRQLLQAITSQMALVYENVWLKDQAARERKIKHDVLAHLEDQQINIVKQCPVCGACYDGVTETCAKDGSELALSLPVERTVDEKYRLEQMIGFGGMGAVYEATDLRLNRRVAIKILLGNMFGDHTALRRFEREAQASARLNHPNVITIFDYGSIRTRGAYLVMELVRGSTLRSELKRTGQLAPATAAEWFRQILDGVKAAHDAGVVHRDLKPENILISTDVAGTRQIKIVDFGLARVSHVDAATEQGLTMPGTVMGTVAYMSPEQVLGEDIDQRADIFSLGVMVVEALTGCRPFVGRTTTELFASILQTPFHLAGDSPEVEYLSECLQKCLAKHRTGRYPSVAPMQRELIAAVAQCPAFPPIVRTAAQTEGSDYPTGTLQ